MPMRSAFTAPTSPRSGPGSHGRNPTPGLGHEERWLSYLGNRVHSLADEIDRLAADRADFEQRYAGALTDGERRELVLDLARRLGPGSRTLRGDRRALRRWFGREAVLDRSRTRQGRAERRLTLVLERLGALAEHVLAQAPPSTGLARWNALGVEEKLAPVLTGEWDPRVRMAAFRGLARAVRALPAARQEAAVGDGTIRRIYRTTLDAGEDVWMQCVALGLLQTLAPAEFRKVLEQRLREPAPGDDLFVRRRGVRVMVRGLRRDPDLASLLPLAERDPSPFVRQGLAEALPEAPADLALPAWRRLVREDACPQVRAQALLAGLELDRGTRSDGPLLEVLRHALTDERDPFVLRVALHVAGRAQARAGSPAEADRWWRALDPVLQTLRSGAPDRRVARWAAEVVERMWCEATPEARALAEELTAHIRSLRPGRTLCLPRGLLEGHDEDRVGRVLSVLAQRDFGLALDRRRSGTRLLREPVFRFRLWRLLHELLHPSPDKRQASSHTIGRVHEGQLRAPSAILAELSETKVPGEPLYVPEEDGWRPHLPLVDDVLTSLNQGYPGEAIRFFTSDGTTSLRPPHTPARRLRAYLSLQTRFAGLARLRNWNQRSSRPARAYADALRSLGFELNHRPHPGADEDPPPPHPDVARFFSAGLGAPGSDLGRRLADYFVSLYENTVVELALFTSAATALFLARHLWLNRTLRRARRSLPLVIGGWGTRGKSGTERLKAALFSGLGYGLFCKTTGCEAMFLHGPAHGETHELFLFRPYDKATIWEQRNVLRLAASLDSEVFLWECMGLSPEFVSVLQRDWTRDHVSTITNTYPDHEDLQGPAGHEIPRVMTRFIPRRSRLLSSEEQMMPILAEGARVARTPMTSVGWLEAGLLTTDVLDRFPYEEHPFNVALVLALARELGIREDFALKTMADRVVPDLGVLRTFPDAVVSTRRLSFTNGMSANERHGCLGNWQRSGFERDAARDEPGRWVTTVVNNRADRLARSRVFASILAQDLSADRHVLIGTNLNGLLGYTLAAWEERMASLSLWKAGEGEPGEATRRFEREARWLRIAITPAAVRSRFEVALGPTVPGEAVRSWLDERASVDRGALAHRLDEVGVDPDVARAALDHLEGDDEACRTYATLADRIRRAEPGERPAIERDVRRFFTSIFRAKLVVIEDPQASGEAVVHRIARETPPHHRNRVMGLQNIKGTGLDFVYRFVAWQACHATCQEIRSGEPERIRHGLADLAGFTGYGLLCENEVEEVLALARESPVAQREGTRVHLEHSRAALRNRLTQIRTDLHQRRAGTGIGAWMRLVAEAFVDAGDAIRRRWRADRIYRDLMDERIGLEQAALELKRLTQRQKGGWLGQH